jgi:hypothetical protein
VSVTCDVIATNPIPSARLWWALKKNADSFSL